MLEKGKAIGPKTEQGVEAYKEFMGYYAIGYLFRDIVTGNLTSSNRTKSISTPILHITEETNFICSCHN